MAGFLGRCLLMVLDVFLSLTGFWVLFLVVVL